MPFTEEQAPFFFGRDSEREIITANLMAARLTLLYGPSGVGKSSVLNAGVVHNLRQVGRAAVESGTRPEFAIVSFKNWRDDPLAALERTIEHEVRVIGRGAWFADRLQSCAEEIDADILVILDQFEEFFLYHPVEEGDRSFAAEFARAVNRRDLRASFLVSMREDSIAKLDSFKGRISNLFENRLSIDRLDRQQARQSIVKPIEQFNRLLAAPGQRYTIEPELVEAVLDQVRANPGLRDDTGKGRVRDDIDSGIETPHLQLVMTRLWQEELAANSTVLRLETLRRLGGAGEIVRKHVDSALDALSPAERDAAATIFQYLVTPAGTKIALGVEDLYPNAGMSATDLRSLLVKLSSGESRILTSVAPAPDQPARERYQIFHDVLAQKVLDWRSRYVKAKERAAAESVAAEERRKAEKESRAAARLRRLLVLVAALFVVTAIAAWVAWRQTKQANAGRQAAVQSRLEAEQSRAEAEAARHNADASRLDVLAANASNRALEAEKQKFQLSAQEAQARLAGRNEQANQLRAQVAAADTRAATERQKGDSLTAEAQKERNAAQQSTAQAEQLKTQVQAARSADTTPPAPVTAPPGPETTVKPLPTPAPDTGRPSEAPVAVVKPPVSGDYRETYRKAIDAKNRKHWDDAARLFQTAVQLNGTDTGERINVSGFGNIEPYVPKYYLGLSLKNLGKCGEAVQLFDESERDGAVQKTTLYKSLQQYRQECQKKH
jgi:hypothetical protein